MFCPKSNVNQLHSKGERGEGKNKMIDIHITAWKYFQYSQQNVPSLSCLYTMTPKINTQENNNC